MRLAIYAVGRLRRSPERELFEDYWARAARMAPNVGISCGQIRELPESRQDQASARRRQESAALMAALPGGGFAIVLDESGRQLSSAQLAATIGDNARQGVVETAFLIGGPDGHDTAIADKSGMVVSLGKLTWPHRLVRIMLAEQLYRAITILSGHPYHRE